MEEKGRGNIKLLGKGTKKITKRKIIR